LDLKLTRQENDERLLSQITSIKTAENIQLLVPFAKAYLGLFYVIDSELTATDKVGLLANSELADAVLEGFLSSLSHEEIPSVEKIGHAAAIKKEYSEGYVILAGLDLIVKKSLADIKNLNPTIVEKAIAFSFSNKTGYSTIWFDYLLTEHADKVIPVISCYWIAMLKNQGTCLPGINLVLSDKPDVRVVRHCILPLLKNWSQCKEKTLIQLLNLAFKYSEAKQFLTVCEYALENDEQLNEKTRLYWMAAAYLLSPDKYFARLSDYAGRAKIKIMPLLDFMALILSDKNDININFNNQIIVQLLRMVAPIFPPQHHVYGTLGELDVNSKNVMSLFYHLAHSNDDVTKEIKLLRKVRVMKIYSAVIDNLLALQTRKNNESDFIFPDFDVYIEMLAKDNCLQGRSNKFDLR